MIIDTDDSNDDDIYEKYYIILHIYILCILYILYYIYIYIIDAESQFGPLKLSAALPSVLWCS